MAKIDASAALLHDQLGDYDIKNLNDGLADDDSWVENTSQNDEDFKEFEDIVDDHLPPLEGLNSSTDEIGHSCHAIDFRLHTIVEESCEESEFDWNKFNVNYGYTNQRNDDSATNMERCFVFGFEDRDISSNCLEDSSSDIFSDLSDSVEQEIKITKNENDDEQFHPPKSRLEKYFLSEFMGFSAENKSDSSVGSDSEGKPTPSQRKKKLRTRRTPRSNHSSFDSLLFESAEPAEQSIESLGSSESDIDTLPKVVVTGDKLDNINAVKRKKNYRKRELFEHTTLTPSTECDMGEQFLISDIVSNKSKSCQEIEQVFLNTKGDELKNNQCTKIKTSLNRADSFNNWSSDEETNIMMSKMRKFFKTLIAVKTNNASLTNCSIPNKDQIVLCKTKSIQFPYFESELIRLMKTVPGINNQQLREIVEYLSSEDAWSDSNDSSDFNASNIDLVYKDEKQNQYSAHCNGKSDSAGNANEDNRICFIQTETALLYTNFFKSLMVKNFKDDQKNIIDIIKNDEHMENKCLKTEQLLVNIGRQLVNLMREDNSGSNYMGTQNSHGITEIPNLNLEEIRCENILNNADCSSVIDSPAQLSVSRSKSQDILLGTTNKIWHSYSNTAVNENPGDTSDCDRFSWRGSFESALLVPRDSKNNLSNCRENGSCKSHWPLLNRGSVDNLWCTSFQTRKHLDRVQSCGSILDNEEVKCLEIQKKWLSTFISNKLDQEASFTRILQENILTNSLPGLPSMEYTACMSHSQFDRSEVQSQVKSARYRSPAVQSDIVCTSIAKRYENNLQGETRRLNASQTAITSSSHSDDFPMTELSKKTNISPLLQEKTLFHRSTSNVRHRSESLRSICSDYRNGNVKVKGQVEFGMQYNYKINAFEIYVVQCRDLAPVTSKKCKNNPYVKVYVLPDLSKCAKRKTKVKKQTLNPVFKETLRFPIPISKLKKSSIWLSVWNSDILGRNDFLGEVNLDLRGKVFDTPQSEWYTLQQKSEIAEGDSKYRGNLIVAFKFIPSEYKESNGEIANINSLAKGKLYILVKEAKYFFENKSIGTCDTFCKSYLLPVRTKSTKQKTHIIKKSFNPVWNFTFVYEDLTINELSKRALELTVWNHDRLISNQLIGGVRFSLETGINNRNEVNWMDFDRKEMFLWREMMNRPNFWIEGSVKLRSNLNEILEDNNVLSSKSNLNENLEDNNELSSSNN